MKVVFLGGGGQFEYVPPAQYFKLFNYLIMKTNESHSTWKEKRGRKSENIQQISSISSKV